MKLTCVTATFNCVKAGNRERLIRCVKSVEALKIEHEHLIYDGASSDGTVEILRALEGNTSGLTVVSEPDTGIYNALNKGVRDAKGDWFYVLGSDDCIISADDLYAALLEGEKQEADIVAAPAYTTEDKMSVMSVGRGRVIGFMPYPHQGMLIRTSIVRDLQGFDERFKIAADYDMLLRASIRNLKIAILGTGFTLYNKRGLSSDVIGCTADFNAIVAKNLNLTEREALYYGKKNVLPLKVCLCLLFNKSPSIRYSARYYFMRWFANRFGLLKKNGVLLWH